MYDNCMILERARVVREPTVRQVGDKTLVTLSVASNPIGEKAKDRYETIFVDLTYSGARGERAAQVKVGDTITARGAVGLRTYTKKDGDKGFSWEIPYPESLVITPKASPTEDAPAEAAPQAKAGKKAFDF